MLNKDQVSTETYYRQLNFHPTRLLDAIRTWMVDSHGFMPLALQGKRGSGREYCLEAVAHQKTWQDFPFTVVTIDWDEQSGGDGISLQQWINRQLQASGGKATSWNRLFAQAFDLSVQPTPSSTLPITFVLKIAATLAVARTLLETCIISSGRDLPEIDPYTMTCRLLERSLTDQCLIINIRNADLLDKASAERWLNLTMALDQQALAGQRHGRLLLALSCSEEARPVELLGLRREKINIVSLAELSRSELGRVLDRNFRPNNFSNDFVDNLHLYGSMGGEKRFSYPAMLGRAFGLLLVKNLVVRGDDCWSVDHERHGVAEEIATVIGEPLVRFYHKRLACIDDTHRADAERFMEMTALCGKWAPQELLMEYIGIKNEDDQDALLDCLEAAFVEVEPQILIDEEYTLPGFPQTAVYRLAIPLLALILMPQHRMTTNAVGLLAFLEKRLPLRSRAEAGLLWELATRAGDQVCENWRERLGWYLDQEMSKSLEERLFRDLKEGNIRAGSLLTWALHERNSNQRSTSLFLAITKACDHWYESQDGVPENLEGGWFYNLCAVTLNDLGHHTEALEKQMAALVLAQRIFPQNHPNIASILSSIGYTLGALGRYEEALEKMRAALEIRQRILSRDHSDIAISLNDVGYILDYLGRYEEALEKMRTALEIQQRSLPQDHPHIAQSLNNVGHMLGQLGHHNEALEKQLTALEIRQRVLPENHPDIAQSFNNVGVWLSELGRHEEALEKEEAALEIRQRVLPSDHPDIASSLDSIGSTLGALGRYDEALEKHMAAIEIMQQTLSSNHPDIARSFNSVGFTLGKLGRYEEALEKMRTALKIRKMTLPQDHPDIATSLNNVGYMLEKLGRHKEAMEIDSRGNTV